MWASNQLMSTRPTRTPLTTVVFPKAAGTVSVGAGSTVGADRLTCQAFPPRLIHFQNWVRMKMSPYWPVPPGNAIGTNRPEFTTLVRLAGGTVTVWASAWNTNRSGVMVVGTVVVAAAPCG